MIFHVVLFTALHAAAQWPADRTLQFTVERCLIIITSNPSAGDDGGDGRTLCCSQQNNNNYDVAGDEKSRTDYP